MKISQSQSARALMYYMFDNFYGTGCLT